jgi:hypothetical protein
MRFFARVLRRGCKIAVLTDGTVALIAERATT